jgi:hypothetical protein
MHIDSMALVERIGKIRWACERAKLQVTDADILAQAVASLTAARGPETWAEQQRAMGASNARKKQDRERAIRSRL